MKWHLWLYFHRISFCSCLRCAEALTEACLKVSRQTTCKADRQTDSNANRQRKAMMETEAESTPGCREWGWPELCLFWFPLLVCTGLGLLQRFSNHVRIFLWVWRACGVHYCQNFGDYTQKHTHLVKKCPFIPIYNNYIWLFKLSRPPHQLLALKKLCSWILISSRCLCMYIAHFI